MKQDRENGFTLIELLVVIIIIGILAAVAIPVFLHQRTKGWDAQAKSDSRNLAEMEEAYLVDQVAYMDFDSTVGSSVEEFVGYRDSDQVVTRAKASASSGYCIVSKSRSGYYFVYDSLSGGLTGPGYATMPASFPAGTACALGAPAMP
jgi:type IV pilus assembly protein PilA